MKRSTGWTKKQKTLAVLACKSVNIDDEQRSLILRQLGGRALVNGRPTSTSGRLSQNDFEKFMAIVESYSADGRLLNYKPYHWQEKHENGTAVRLLHRARGLANALTDAGVAWTGIVRKAVGRDFDSLLGNLDEDELNKAIDAMTAVGKRPGKRGAA